ncbi:MAG: ATP-binding protein [Myxococcota bacterium]
MYKLEGGDNSWLSSLGEVGWGIVSMSAVIVWGTKWLLRGRDMPLRAQVAVLKVKQATAAHESKRPLINCRDSCDETEEEAAKLSDAISALPVASPAEKQVIQRFCATIKQRSHTLKISCQGNIDFLNELIDQTHDPLQYIPKREIVSMNKCVRLGLSTANFGEARKRLRIIIKEDFEVFGNAYMLGSVVVNGVENAIKHSGPNDYIEIRVQRIYGRNRFSIYNTGEGIVGWILPFVFTAGFSQTPGGSGTGLAFSKWAIEQMDGLARVWSIWKECACFEYDFPNVTDQMREQAQELEKQAQQNDPYKLLDEALKRQQAAQRAKWSAV